MLFHKIYLKELGSVSCHKNNLPKTRLDLKSFAYRLGWLPWPQIPNQGPGAPFAYRLGWLPRPQKYPTKGPVPPDSFVFERTVNGAITIDEGWLA